MPLSALALTLIRHLRRRFGETDYVIPSRCWKARDGAPITVRALSQGIRDRRSILDYQDSHRTICVARRRA